MTDFRPDWMLKNSFLCRLARAGLVLPAALGLSSSPAAAQSMPSEFDFSVTYTYVARRAAVDLGGANTAVAIDASFVATNDAGGAFMNNMFGQCSYVLLQSGGAPQMLGGCSYEDKDGDRLYETFRMLSGGPGESAFLGGTGKFSGIRCDGKFTSLAASKDRTKGVGKKSGSCKFA